MGNDPEMSEGGRGLLAMSELRILDTAGKMAKLVKC